MGGLTEFTRVVGPPIADAGLACAVGPQAATACSAETSLGLQVHLMEDGVYPLCSWFPS